MTATIDPTQVINIAQVIELVAKVPSAFWGTVAGSFFTLLGIHLSNRSAAKRLSIQHDFDRSRNKEEADLLAKKNIYTDALNSFNELAAYITKFPNLTVEQLASPPKFNNSGISLIAPEETLIAAFKITSYLTNSLLNLFPKRGIILTLENDAQIAHDLTKEILLEQKRLNREMFDFNLRQDQNKNIFENLQNNFDFQKEQISIYRAEHAQKSNLANKLKMELSLECIEIVFRAQNDLCDLVSKFRNKIGYEANLNIYKSELEKFAMGSKEKFLEMSREIGDIFLIQEK